jgi:hypothetical protein
MPRERRDAGASRVHRGVRSVRRLTMPHDAIGATDRRLHRPLVRRCTRSPILRVRDRIGMGAIASTDRHVDAHDAHASVRRCVARRLDADSIDQSTGPRFAVS